MHTRKVEELNGLYGTFTLSERVLQQIWLRQDFATEALETDSGLELEVVDAGQWNHGAGPDFKDAVLRIGGELLRGDVEIHFNRRDWELHGHAVNPAFANVILHVVLFKQKATKALRKLRSSDLIETFYLLPKLERDLESYAEAMALREIEAVDHLEWVNSFMAISEAKRRGILQKAGRLRWKQKVIYAKKRLESSGWSKACHQYLLEVLGYARNRLPMARIADRYPLELWENGAVEIEAAYESERANWARGLQRPANDPRRRLSDYLRLAQTRSNWPRHLRVALENLPVVAKETSTGAFRRRVGLAALQRELHCNHLCRVAGATRVNTVMVDAFLPMAQAAGLLDSFCYWWHWPAGDRPNRQHQFLRQTGLCNRSHPICNGWLQGVLQLFILGGWRGDSIDLS